jgi:hypothetical protein
MNRSDDYLDHAGSALAEPDAGHDDSATKEVERLQKRLQHTKHFYESRMERLAQFAREELAEDLQKRFFNIYANGTADWREPHSQTEVDRLLATVSSLTARNARLEKGLEHYADDIHWRRVNSAIKDFYCADSRDGFEVAREALKGGEDEIK